MKLVHENCSIECEAANVVSRKILRGSYVEFTNIGKCTTYKCTRNSEALITKQIETVDMKPKHKATSNIDIGDMLECEDLFLAINTAKGLKISIGMHSGRHNAQKTSTNCYTFAEISRQLVCIPKLSSNTPTQIG